MPQMFPEPIQTMHDYIQYFGLMSLECVYLESRLKNCLRDMARARSAWPITPKRLAQCDALHAETTLGGLITEFEKRGGPHKLIVNLRELARDRNELLHNVFLLTDIQRGHIPLAPVKERTLMLKDLSERTQGRMHAVMKFHYPVSVELGRLQEEHHEPSTWKELLERMRIAVQGFPDA